MDACSSSETTVFERQIADPIGMMEELEEKMVSVLELMVPLRNRLDELQKERDCAVKEAGELRKKIAEESSSSKKPQLFTDFSFSEIEAATGNFDPSMNIGEWGYGTLYRGFLRHTQVAIKMFQPQDSQDHSDFQQEMDVVSKLRHPNLIALIGACPEAWSLVYEYLPNGSLEDRLNCRDNTPPLSWQTRIRIATEICSALIFLHSHKPHRIVHGDLKPDNILLDANFVSKLSDFGIFRLILYVENAAGGSSTASSRTDPKRTFMYLDPEFLETGELTPMSDVYSFGLVLLRLLTGKPASSGIVKDVQHALDNGNLEGVLDESAGDCPFIQAKQLAGLALRCCERSQSNRPDLRQEVWRVLEPMTASCGGSSSFRLGAEERRQPPSYFVCPIFQVSSSVEPCSASCSLVALIVIV
uniref:RING-type E3 ubiquitin transferase n=1 Tax=Nelumbo nucifera TaxID=4432 RepID=A0A822XGT5_NELNU|nr:TPA_asm: hypothetical protein HUJ06_019784 [Nelumbo nucifera]